MIRFHFSKCSKFLDQVTWTRMCIAFNSINTTSITKFAAIPRRWIRTWPGALFQSSGTWFGTATETPVGCPFSIHFMKKTNKNKSSILSKVKDYHSKIKVFLYHLYYTWAFLSFAGSCFLVRSYTILSTMFCCIYCNSIACLLPIATTYRACTPFPEMTPFTINYG